MHYRFGGSTYDITCRWAQPGSATRLTLDGAESADGTIALMDDEARHAVVLDVRREPAAVPA